jgi:lipopolysaccharide biosynthesis regulator YciM
VPKRRLSFKDKSVNIGKHNSITAQYYCELAAEALAKDSFKTAERLLNKALIIDKKCARATLLKAHLLQERGESQQAVHVLDELTQQDPLLLVEALALLQRCFGDDKPGLIQHLHQWLEYFPSVQIQKTLFENLQTIDESQASEFLLSEIQKRPTIIGLKLFLEQQALFDTGKGKEAIALLRQLMSDVLKEKIAYLCTQCGFSGSQLHWLCPQCQSWDSIRRIRGSEGD